MTTETNWFQIVHSYWNHARAGRAERITCPDCDLPLIVSYEEDSDYPVFECFSCDKKIRPGLGVLHDIRDAVKRMNND